MHATGPELVKGVIESYEKHSYTNKVDIWAMGCILYELIFRRKAFANEFRVHQFALQHYCSVRKQTFPVDSISDVPTGESWKLFLSHITDEMLEVDAPKRPTARPLRDVFDAALEDIPKLTTDTRSLLGRTTDETMEEILRMRRKGPEYLESRK